MAERFTEAVAGLPARVRFVEALTPRRDDLGDGRLAGAFFDCSSFRIRAV
jgi:hypothetical protein